jgi:hypothetical protein
LGNLLADHETYLKKPICINPIGWPKTMWNKGEKLQELGQLSKSVGSELLATVTIKAIFWNELPCALVRVTDVS